ncbi:hypothetical protein M0802_016202, partial [Mischocyttarus mexicanus]
DLTKHRSDQSRSSTDRVSWKGKEVLPWVKLRVATLVNGGGGGGGGDGKVVVVVR